MAEDREDPRTHEAMRAVLVRAVSRNCPLWLASDREDIVQSAIVRVLERTRGGGDEVRTSTYLWKTAYSVVVDEIRKRRGAREVSLDDPSVPTQRSGSDPGADHRAAERGRALRQCLTTLVEPRRFAVVLHLEGHGLKDGAALMGWSSKRFENLVYRGLDDLRKCLAGKGVGP